MNHLYLAVNILLSLPYAAILIFISLIIFGYKDKINTGSVIIYTLILGLLDAFLTQFIDPSGSINGAIEPIVSVVLLIVLFNIEVLSSIVMSISSYLIYMFLALPSVFVSKQFIGFVPGNPNPEQTSQSINLATMYSIYLVIGIIFYFLYRKSYYIINLRRFQIFNQDPILYKKHQDTLKYILIFSLPLFICIFVNYFIYTTSETAETGYVYTFFVVNIFAVIISFIIMFSLIRRLTRLNFIESEYRLQQSYMKNIDSLLKELYAQKHGFNNHLQTIFALLQAQKSDDAKDYINKMHDIASCQNSALPANNPTLYALLNVKASYAQKCNVKFDINISNYLEDMNFSAYELVEVLGNVIDNAIEAASAGKNDNKYVRIDILLDDKNYVFDVENSGATIPPQIIDKIFEEGFTTKETESNAHGFGLYICKHILELYNGKIDVLSSNNITNFKISLPIGAKNEFGAL